MNSFAFRLKSVLLVLGLIGLSGMLVAVVFAQAASPWTVSSNVSQSGAASLPVIVAAPTGLLHAVWWDATDGTQYARTTSITSTDWTAPVSVPALVGSRETSEGRDLITPPDSLYLIATARGDVHALWLTDDDELVSAQTQGAAFGAAASLAEVAALFDVSADVSNTLHLAYVRTANTDAAPSGLYYRSHTGARWNGASLVFDSPYFRSARPDRLHLSVAGNGRDQVIVAWDDPQLGQSVYARSDDGGQTWTAPVLLSGSATSRAQRARVISTPDDTFLMIWQDSAIGGCGFVQSVSTDGGQTWSTFERVLSTITRCAENWSYANGRDGRVWLIGRAAAPAQAAAFNAVTLAAWDGTAWSKPIDAALAYIDPASNRQITLNCIHASVGGDSAGIIGCDPNGDVWAARQAVPLTELIGALQPVWQPLEILSDRTSPALANDLPAVAADASGNFHAVWSQLNDRGSVLLASSWNGTRWSRAAIVLRTPDQPSGSVAQQPALRVDSQGKAHIVWNGGTNGAVYYSWTYARDFTLESGWAEPVALPMAAAISQWPDLALDPRGTALFAIYAVPFNEQRGIYLTRSDDGGATWSAPITVWDAVAAQHDSVDKPRLAYDAVANVLHAVWVQAALPGSTTDQAIYYARSSDRGQTWSAPVKMVAGAVDWPRLSVLAANQIGVAWTQPASQVRADSPTPLSVWAQFSSNGGEGWTTPQAVAGFEQISGAFDLSSDEQGRADIVAVGQAASGESALLHATWNGQAWLDQSAIPLGQTAVSGNGASGASAPGAGRLMAVLRAWLFAPAGGAQLEAVATGREIPPVEVVVLPTLTPGPQPTALPTATPQPTATPRPQITSPDISPVTETPGPSPLIISGLLAAVIVVAGAAGAFYLKRR